MRQLIAVWLACLFGAAAHPAHGAAVPESRFVFKEPGLRVYRQLESEPRLLSAKAGTPWLRLVSDDASALPFEIGSRIILQLKPGTDPQTVLRDLALPIVRQMGGDLYVLAARNPLEAATLAQGLTHHPLVLVSHPEMKRPIKLHREYAPPPNDPSFTQQWHLEFRATNGTRLGPDINSRAAWPYQRGGQVPVAVVDSGIDLSHPELLDGVNGMPHFNFYYGNTNAGPSSFGFPGAHGTSVAGLVGARANNARGISGVAPEAKLASWVIFETAANDVASEGQLADMFQYQSNAIPIQNHSWSFSYFQQLAPGVLEEAAISNAVHFGRNGKGVIMVRSAGNDRLFGVNANDDGYTKDPQIIAVGSVRQDGQVASYSNPGACLLLAAPSGDASQGFSELLTTDLQGTLGANTTPSTTDAGDYRSFSGTSASAPVISGIVALMLEANPALSYRDVQQVLINASQQTDLADPLLKVNQAGYQVGPNTGFGVPDAGRAVRLAKTWPLRPPITNLVFVNDLTNQIPNQGLRIETFGTGVPVNLASIIATPSVGLHPEDLTPFYPLVDVGLATNTITADLTGKAALIRRGTNTFLEKINLAAAAGARLAIIANYTGNNTYLVMNGTYRAAIPSVFIGGDDGTALQAYVATNSLTQVRAIVFSASYTNHVTTPLLVEHVGVRVRTDHPYRGDLRITVTSPAGTRSVLQPLNDDFAPGPVDWTYWTTHHFFESSQGIWNIQVSDENRVTFGNTLYTELILRGVPITDADRDGLEDTWELAHFQNLAARPAEDADDDGESNISEFLQGTDPLSPPGPFLATVSRWSPDYLRIGWPANRNRTYDVLGGTTATDPLTVLTNLPGSFDTGEWFVPTTGLPMQFFMIRSARP